MLKVSVHDVYDELLTVTTDEGRLVITAHDGEERASAYLTEPQTQHLLHLINRALNSGLVNR